VNETPQPTGPKGFLRENWIFIVAPFALILVALILLACFAGDGAGGFLYNIF
jgi:hypothetical protein